MLVILASLEMEARAVSRAIAIPITRDAPAPLTHAGAGANIHVIGIKTSKLRQVVAQIDLSRTTCVAIVGLAGGLDPELRVGDVVLDLPAALSARYSTASLPELRGGSRFRFGAIHTAVQMVASPAEKKRLFEQTGASAVDMEQSIVREAFAGRGIPVIGLRAISDDARATLDPILPTVIDAVGRPRPIKMAWHLLHHPTAVAAMVRLGFASSTALTNLAFATHWLANGSMTL